MVPKRRGDKAFLRCVLLEVLTRSMLALEVAPLAAVSEALQAAKASGAYAKLRDAPLVGPMEYLARGALAWFDADSS